MTDPAAQKAVEFAAIAELVGRQCELRDYERGAVPGAVRLDSELIAYASPDSTFAVTRELLEGARESVLIGIYDFTAPYVAELLLAAVARGVAVTVMIDLDRRKGEPELWDTLVEGGCSMSPAPSCASVRSRYFPSCHEKVVVIDGEWVLVQSGNYSENSIPRNEGDGTREPAFTPGNRDMGIAVRSSELAGFFADLLRRDIALERGVEEAPAALVAGEALPPLEAAAPAGPPVLFPSRRLRADGDVTARPVISPENYLDVVAPLLAQARSSIRVEQQYMRVRQPGVGSLLAAIGSALERSPELDVRLIVAVPLGGNDRDRQRADLEAMRDHGLDPQRHVRLLNPKHFVHCHNKLVVVDERLTLLSSQNWSDFALKLNREAGLLLDSAELAAYYGGIFDSDWSSAVRVEDADEALASVDAAATATVPIRAADYVDV